MVLLKASTFVRPAKEGVPQLTKRVNLHGIVHDHNSYIILPHHLTCAHQTSRIRSPPAICSTHCPHSPSWDKPWITPEEYLSSLSCVLIGSTGTISWKSGITTVYWRKAVYAIIMNKQLSTRKDAYEKLCLDMHALMLVEIVTGQCQEFMA